MDKNKLNHKIGVINEYFSKHITEEELKSNIEKYHLKNMISLVDEYFQIEYKYSPCENILYSTYEKDRFNNIFYQIGRAHV